MTVHTDLSRQNNSVLNGGTTGNTDLGRKQHVPANMNAMADLHQVIDLRSGLYPCLTNSGTVHRDMGPNFNIVLDNHIPHLWNLLVRAVRPLGKPEAVAAYHRGVLQHHAVTEHYSLTHSDVRVNHAIGPDNHTGTKRNVRMNNGPWPH